MRHHPEILVPERSVLVIIDVQERINAVMSDQGHIPRLSVLYRAFRTLGLPVLVTEQYPKGLGPTVPELAGLLEGPPLVKDTFSAARDEAFMAALEALHPHRIVVTGIETHVCVTQTSLDLIHAGFQVHVPHDAVCSRRPRDREWALRRLAAAGAVVSSTESALFELLDRCDTEDFKTIAKLVKELPVD
jgi:nicotinamidase-related amidase